MKKIVIGDVFGIKTKYGFGIFQYVADPKRDYSLIRVFPGFAENKYDIEKDFLSKKELYFAHFILRYSLFRKKIVFLGNYELPQNLVVPTFFRSKVVHGKNKKISWYVFEEDKNTMKFYEDLDKDLYILSDWNGWDYKELRDKLESFWKPINWK